MKCHKVERMISDHIDLVLSDKKKARLAKHLDSCSGCRSYQERMKTLHQETQKLGRPKLTPEYRRKFALRLEDRLSREASRPTVRPAPSFFGGLRPVWRWTTVATAATALLLLGIMMFRPQPTSLEGRQMVYSVADMVKEIAHEIADDQELEQAFNSLLLASIDNAFQTQPEEMLAPGLYENPLHWEELTLEELRYIENEIKKEIKS